MASVNKKFAVEKGLEVGDDALVVDADNNRTGIGKTNPNFGLDVATTANFDGVLAANQVGIGSTQPGKDIDFNKDLIIRKRLYDGNEGAGANNNVLISVGTGVSWSAGADIQTDASGLRSQIQYKKSDGKFGGADNLVYDDTNDRVGIGSTQPEYILDVKGAFRLDGQLKDSNDTVGAAGSVLAADNSGNTQWVGAGASTLNIFFVAEDGNDASDGKTVSTAKRSVKAACGVAKAGDVIRVAGGIYPENNPIFVPRNVTIDGDDLRNTQILPSNTGQDLFQVHNGALLQNMSFIGSASTAAMVTFPPQGIVNRHRWNKDNGTHIYVGGTVANAFTVTGGGGKTVTDATYNPLTGVLVLTSAGHGLNTTNTITIGLEKLVFTCDADNHATNHPYPRVGDPAYNTALAITSFTSDTITVNAGRVKSVDSIKVGPNWHAGNAITPTAILYDPTSGVTTVTSAGHGLNNSNTVGIVTNALNFQCEQDNFATNHPYPRATDPLAGIFTAITAHTSDTITFNVGDAGSHARIAGIITQSPYVRNCTNFVPDSIGMRINGDHTNGTKSMVVDSYTQYNQGGIGVTISNDGYAQLVSIFTVCDEYAISCVSGGQCDLNNSNASFGTFGLVASGIGTVTQTGILTATANEDDNIVTVSGITDRPYSGQVFYIGEEFNEVIRVNVTNPGSGYTSSNPPLVTIGAPSGPNGSNAEGTAVVSGFGSITAVNMFATGSQYRNIPSITIAPPTSGITATATAELEPSYFTINSATPVTAGVSTITIDQTLPATVGVGSTVPFARQSLILASSYTFEFVGSGHTIPAALPRNGGVTIPENETVSELGGRVVYTSTDERGNLKVGDGFTINQQTGTVTGDAFNKSIQATLTPLIIALGGQM
tara:strand:+ start:392 stop:3046 length:2655 start_codon:yes stop_codon:yes gene_type:complete